MSSPNSSTMLDTAPSTTTAALTTAGRDRPKVEYFLISAEVTVDHKGYPTQVKLVNPSGDNWVDQKLAYQLRHRRYTPPGTPAPAASMITVVTRVQVTN